MPNHFKRFLFYIPVVALWGTVFLLSLEAYAVCSYMLKSRSVQYSCNWNLRGVREAFHGSLWSEPWKEYLPNASLTYTELGKTYQVSINENGFRGGNLVPGGRHGSLSIVCIGGSTTVEGDNDESTYPAYLEKKLRQSGVAVSVANCGISSLKSSGYDRTINYLINRVHPDLVIEYNAVNDICRELIPLWRNRLGRPEQLLLKSRFISTFFSNSFIPDDDIIRADIDRYIVANLVTAADTFARHGSKFAVASFTYPSLNSMTGKQYAQLDNNLRYWWNCDHVSYRNYCHIVDIYNERLRSAFAGSQAIYLPLAESGDFPVSFFNDICHLNDSGIIEKSKRLSTLLLSRLEKIKK